MAGVEVEERLKEEVKKAVRNTEMFVRNREMFVKGGKLKGGGVKKNGDRGGREGRRVIGELGNV